MTTTTLTRVSRHRNPDPFGLVGYLDVSYAELVAAFGEPTPARDDYKSDAEWRFDTEQGAPVTIYNYKDGRNYLGDEGLDVSEIRDWHVGGNGPYAIEAVREVLGRT